MIKFMKLQETNTKIIYHYADSFGSGDEGTVEFSKSNYEKRKVFGKNKRTGQLIYSEKDVAVWAQKLVTENFPKECFFCCGY